MPSRDFSNRAPVFAALPFLGSLAVVLLFGAWFSFTSYDALETHTRRDAEEHLGTAVEVAHSLIHQVSGELLQLGEHLDLDVIDTPRLTREIYQTDPGRFLGNVAVLRPDGAILSVGDPSSALKSLLHQVSENPASDTLTVMPAESEVGWPNGRLMIARVHTQADGKRLILGTEVPLAAVGSHDPAHGLHRITFASADGPSGDSRETLVHRVAGLPLEAVAYIDRPYLFSIWLRRTVPYWCGLLAFLAGAFLTSFAMWRWARHRLAYEQRLEEAHRALKLRDLMVQSVGESILLYDREGQIIDCNPAAEKLLVCSRAELLSGIGRARPVDKEIDPEGHDRAIAARLARIDRGESVTSTGKYRLRTGRVATLEMTMFGVFDDTGAVIGRVTVARDVSERQQALDQMMLHAQALESVSSGVLICGPAWMDFRTVYVNRGFTALTGYEAEDAIGINPRFLECADSEPDTLARLQEALTRERPITVEVVNRRRSGETFINRINMSPVVLRPGETARYFVCVMEDVTAQRTGEAALQRQALVLETINDIVCAIGPDMRITSCNGAAERMFGPRESLIGRPMGTVNEETPEERAARRAALTAAFAERRPWIGTVRVRNQKGERRLLEAMATKLDDGSGENIGFVIVARDVTDARESEAKLRRHALIMEQINDGVMVFDKNLRLVECNQALCQMLRTTREDLIGTDSSAFLADPSAVMAELPERQREIAEFGQSVREQMGRRSDGTLVAVENTMYPLRDEQGAEAGWVMLCRDLSVRREAERRHDRTQRLYESLVTAAFDAIISVDHADHIVVFNTAAERMFRCRAADVLDRPLEVLLPELPDTLEEGVVAELKAVRADGSDFPIEASISHIDTGEGLVLTIMARDLTQTRAMENQLRQAEKMQAVGQLSGGIAHDFNNMLSVIGNSIDIALDNLGRGKQAESALLRANRAVESAANLVEKLLAFSRKSSAVRSVGRVEDVVWDMMPVLFRTLPENIKIKADIAERLPSVTMDAAQVENAILNLAINARDAMPNGGALVIRVQAREGVIDRRGRQQRMVALEVSDSGCGMSSAVRERAVEPFFTTKSSGEGTGLGLSMVYSMMEQCGGALEIESAEGEGTTIRLLFPASEALPAPRKVTPADLIRGQGQAILVVEDNDDLRYAMIEQLRSIGYTPIEALDCSHALHLVEARPEIDVLLSDVIMASDMNGKELAHRACAIRPELSVILCTGYAHTVLESGVEPDWQVLRKPVTRRQLAQALARAVSAEELPAA